MIEATDSFNSLYTIIEISNGKGTATNEISQINRTRDRLEIDLFQHHLCKTELHL
jgi:hypothetical protein